MKQLACLLLTLAACSLASGILAAEEELLPADRPIEEVVDHYINAKLKTETVTPAPPAADATLLRRTMLDLVGRTPTTREAKEFIESAESEKRRQLIDGLMKSPSFVRHQVNAFDTMLMYGSGKSLKEYLRVAISENRPWDQMFREMMIGDAKDEKLKPANQFLTARVSDLDKLANQASVTFFGVNVSCAKCHDHPLVSGWTQDHFYGMKSFFSRTFEHGEFVGERDYGVVGYKTTDGESRTAQLMFLTGTVVDEPESKEPSDKEKKDEKKRLDDLKKKKEPAPAPKFSRRAKLVEVALKQGENDYFARAIVNRIWDRLFGRGLVTPVDQMHPENRPTHPRLLRWLARDLVEHDYDLQRLIRGLVLSDTYARSSRWDESTDWPKSSLFAVARVRPLTPHQYATSLRLAATNPDSFDAAMKPEDFHKKIEGIENSAGGLAGMFQQPVADFQIGVDEALLMNNSDRVMNELLRDSGDSLVGKLKATENRREAIEAAIWSVCSRAPEAEELDVFEAYLNQREDRLAEAYRQIVWALMTSSEVRFNY